MKKSSGKLTNTPSAIFFNYTKLIKNIGNNSKKLYFSICEK